MIKVLCHFSNYSIVCTLYNLLFSTGHFYFVVIIDTTHMFSALLFNFNLIEAAAIQTFNNMFCAQ